MDSVFSIRLNLSYWVTSGYNSEKYLYWRPKITITSRVENLMADEGGWGGCRNLKMADRGEGVQNGLKNADIINERPLKYKTACKYSGQFVVSVKNCSHFREETETEKKDSYYSCTRLRNSSY